MSAYARVGGSNGGNQRGKGGGKHFNKESNLSIVMYPSDHEMEEEIFNKLKENKDNIVIRRDDDKYTLSAHTLADWVDNNGKALPMRYWNALNNRFGNTDGSLISVKTMLERMQFTEDQINHIDMKNVELYSGVVINHVHNSTVWRNFSSELPENYQLINNVPLCGKLKSVCGEISNGTVHILVKAPDNKFMDYKKSDFVGGKAHFEEYLPFIELHDNKSLFRSFLREVFEELNVTSSVETSAIPLEEVDGVISTPRFNCTAVRSSGNMNISLELIQIAPFFVKIIVTEPL